MNEPKYYPLPWSVSDITGLPVTTNHEIVALYGERDFVLTACNAHAALVQVVEALEAMDLAPCVHTRFEAASAALELGRKARAVLAQGSSK